MRKGTSPVSRRRPWRLLRLVLLWARKGGAFKNRHFFDLRLLPSYLKNLRRADASERLHYRERQLSFDDTPAFHFKFHRPAALRLPRFSCITPSVNFDDDEAIFLERCREMKALEARRAHEEDSHNEELNMEDVSEEHEEMEEEEEGEQGIDSRAERFIVEFYEQMKLQRQISFLEYNEMLQRGSSG